MVDLHPKNKSVGKKAIIRSKLILIEQEDAQLIKDGEEVGSNPVGNFEFLFLRFSLFLKT